MGADTKTPNGRTFLDEHPVENSVLDDGIYFTNGPVLNPTAYDTTHTHTFGSPVFQWSDDGIRAVAAFVCEDNSDHVMELDATVSSAVKTAADCENDGITEYTAEVTYGGQTYTDTIDLEDIPPLGHKWSEWVVTKEPTETETGTKTRTCENDETHTETEEIPVLVSSSAADGSSSSAAGGSSSSTADSSSSSTADSGSSSAADSGSSSAADSSSSSAADSSSSSTADSSSSSTADNSSSSAADSSSSSTPDDSSSAPDDADTDNVPTKNCTAESDDNGNTTVTVSPAKNEDGEITAALVDSTTFEDISDETATSCESIVIDEGIRKVDMNAIIEKFPNLKEIEMPDTVEEIIWNEPEEGRPDIVIVCDKGSAVAKFAEENGFEVRYIEDEDEPTFALGDINADGVINASDITKLAAHVKGIAILTADELSRADVNGDGKVNVSDITKIAAHVKGIESIG